VAASPLEPRARVNSSSESRETAAPLRAAFLDHLTLSVRDLDASRRFYRAALSPWGSREVALESGEIAFGPEGSEDLVIVAGEPSGPVHLAFAAPDRETVDRFHQAALAAGGRDNGAPGERHYHPGYYAAYVLDPDANNVEAVFHGRSV
jgi:catechol 2,3-dioxygenase-like lactoylglutathione lyase family enzyme